jgi:hypothetical protein
MGKGIRPARTILENYPMNNKMKKLSLAVVGFVGFAAAGAAMAQCPSSLTPPWSAVVATGGSVSSAAPGYASTACKLNAAITGNLGSASAFVRDDTPAAEGRYRAQFLINVDNLTGQNTAQLVRVFAATTEASNAGVSELVKLTVYGNVTGTSKQLGVLTADSAGVGGFSATAVPLTGGTAGVHRVEIEWNKGATGGVKVWVNNTTEATPSATVTANNTAWTGGVDAAVVGLAQASPGFRTAQVNKVVYFDQFDSRRQTFIGAN